MSNRSTLLEELIYFHCVNLLPLLIVELSTLENKNGAYFNWFKHLVKTGVDKHKILNSSNNSS